MQFDADNETRQKRTIDKTLLKDLLKESKASREWILNVRKSRNHSLDPRKRYKPH